MLPPAEGGGPQLLPLCCTLGHVEAAEHGPELVVDELPVVPAPALAALQLLEKGHGPLTVEPGWPAAKHGHESGDGTDEVDQAVQDERRVSVMDNFDAPD